MTKELNITYTDAFLAGVCSTGSRAQFNAVGLNFRKFVITGYSESELYKAFGPRHPIVKQVVDHKRNQKGSSNG